MSSSFCLKNFHWTDFFRHCAVCHATSPPIQWLCSSCFKKLRSFYIPPQHMERLESSLKHVRLIDWTQKNDQFIRKLIVSLKGPQGSVFFNVLAKEFYTRIQSCFSKQKSFFLIPCPPHLPSSFLTRFFKTQNSDQSSVQNSAQEKKDHSYYWGKALSHYTHSPVKFLLKRGENQQSQKGKQISERRKISFIFDSSKLDSSTCFSQDTVFVFTDDVVTSGATAQAVYLALKQPRSFSIWSIFWRELEARK